jgi:hypothetical protein
MATTYGVPPVVTDGLVFAIDPINNASYSSGSATVTDRIGGKSGTVQGSGFGVFPLNGLWDMDQSSDTGIVFSEHADFTLGSGDFAVDVWMRADANANTGSPAQTTRIVSGDKSTDATDWLIYYPGTYVDWYSGGTSIQITIDAGVLYHIVFSRISGTMKAYRDGVEVASNSFTNNLNGTTGLGIGRSVRAGFANAGLLNGAVGPVKIYKGKGLTAAEVLQNYNALKGRFE